MEFDKNGEPSEVYVSEINPGMCCGEISVLRNMNRVLNAYALEGTVLIFQEKSRFQKLMKDVEHRNYTSKIE